MGGHQYDIVLATLNARYQHSSFGLRYLMANLGPLADRAVIKEFVIKKDPTEIVDEILAINPKIVGLGVYIWNTIQSIEVVRQLKAKSPETIVVVGGPEVSFEIEEQEYFQLADFIFKGESDFLFREFCEKLLNENKKPELKIVSGNLPDIKTIRLPYFLYNDDDIKNRVIYVEASRGCPYKCEYCLSSLDVSVRNFDIDHFLAEMETLIQRGARQFKFVDRTFNLSPTVSNKILSFFLSRIELGLFLHFEMVPDRLPVDLRELIEKFPKGSLQFEIGIQTWNPTVARNVSRRQDYTKIGENLIFLRERTGVHTHADLIVGLPGETLESFAKGFDELTKLGPDEVQVGILKRLKGTPINKRSEQFGMKYSLRSPFQILETKDMTSEEIIQMDHFASFWDSIANSGRFIGFMRKFKDDPSDASLFWKFFELSQALYLRFKRTHSIHHEVLLEAVHDYACEQLGWSNEETTRILHDDLKRIGAVNFPAFLKMKSEKPLERSAKPAIPRRQHRFLSEA